MKGDPDMNDVGKNIRRYREQKGLTQDALAERLHVTRQAVSNWETGKNQPDLEMLEAAAKALDLELTDLIYGKKQEYPRFQRKAVVWTIVLGILVFLALMDALFLAPRLLELRGRTFNIRPDAVNGLVALPLGCVAAGMLLPAVLSLWRSVEPGKRVRIVLRILSVLLLIPIALMALYLLGFGWPPRSGWAPLNRAVVFILAESTGFRRRLFLGILPFFAGLCLYPAWVRLRRAGE